MEAMKFGTGKNTASTGGGAFVLQNTRGETVRVFRLESPTIFVIRRADSRRIETVGSLDALKKDSVHFELLAKTSPEDLKKKPVLIGQVGSIRWVDNVARIGSDSEMLEARTLETKKMIGWSAGLQFSLLIVFGLAGLTNGKSPEPEQKMTLLPQAAVEKLLQNAKPPEPVQPAPVPQPVAQPVVQAPPPPPPIAQRPQPIPVQAPALKKHVVVEVSEKKLRKTPVAQVSRVARQNTSRANKTSFNGGGGFKNTGKKGFGTNEAHMNEIGALSSLTNAKTVAGGNGGSGGLNLRAVGTSPGSGAGGKGYGGFGSNGAGGHGLGGIGQGKGQGMANAMYGRGLIAAPFGDGGAAPGSGGYGTRGRAGGGAQGAGYGRSTVVGSWKGTGPHGEGKGGSGWGRGGDGLGPGLDAGDAAVSGGLDREQIADVIARHIGQVTYCYEQGLQRSPSLAGRVSVRFEIGPQGHVSFANVAHSTLQSSLVEGCIVGKLKTWAFPKPQGGVSVAVTYPFTLRRTINR